MFFNFVFNMENHSHQKKQFLAGDAFEALSLQKIIRESHATCAIKRLFNNVFAYLSLVSLSQNSRSSLLTGSIGVTKLQHFLIRTRLRLQNLSRE